MGDMGDLGDWIIRVNIGEQTKEQDYVHVRDRDRMRERAK
jgi:hypothetical protein